MMLTINVVLDDGAYMPTKAHDSDAGWDLRTPVDVVVPGGSSAVIDTGVHVAVPDGYCGLVVSKSGLNVVHDMTSTGLLDAGYTDSIKIKLYNHKRGTDYGFKAGDKITQLVILPLPEVKMVQVKELDRTERGDQGFGSSGR